MSEEVWIRDQYEAAAAELAPLREAFGQRIDETMFVQDEDLVIDALKRRVVMTCPHYHSLTPPPLLAFLSLRVGVCRDCFAQIPEAVLRTFASPEDNRRCDLCEEETEQFLPFGAQIGPAFVTASACPECAERLGLV